MVTIAIGDAGGVGVVGVAAALLVGVVDVGCVCGAVGCCCFVVVGVLRFVGVLRLVWARVVDETAKATSNENASSA